MIISASRRTDIPAFYANWFMNRVRAQYCTVPNPFNRKQVSYVSLAPEDVEVIVFWTRNPRPFLPHLSELDKRGYHYYFQYTVMDNPRFIDPKSPPLEASLKTFRALANIVGPKRVIWRYDPIARTPATDINFHKKTYKQIAQALQGYTSRSVVSIVDIYRKAGKRLREMDNKGSPLRDFEKAALDDLMPCLAQVAQENSMEIVSCAEEIDLRPYGIQAGKCIDDVYIDRIFSLNVKHKKDPSQREACGCVVSKDIGMYDSCLFGCQYCYATTSFDRAKINHEQHDPHSPSLIGWYEAKPNTKQRKYKQGTLWEGT